MKRKLVLITTLAALWLGTMTVQAVEKNKDLVWITQTGVMNAFCFSPDSKFITCACSSNVKVLETTYGSIINEMDCEDITDIKWSNDGRYIIGGTIKKVKVWDAVTYDTLDFLEDNNDAMMQVAVSDDYLVGNYRYDCGIKVWDIKTGKLIKIKKMPQPAPDYTYGTVKWMYLSPDGKYVGVHCYFTKHSSKFFIFADSMYSMENLDTPLPYHYINGGSFSYTNKYFVNYPFKISGNGALEVTNLLIHNTMDFSIYKEFPELIKYPWGGV
ncbi:MAG: Eukaryotic translation initiation factor eIF2A [Bacteroidota bacterium]|nr:Eukaryotic translation initiation factor eIF2A [Bacteroidota bacterium]